jgi:hypothetical protein
MDPLIFVVFIFVIVIVALVLSIVSKAEKAQSTSTVHVEMRGPEARTPIQGLAPDETRRFYMQVHGIFHKNDDGSSRQKIIKSCTVGEEIDLIPEPENSFDTDAVKVCRKNGEQLGYLPSAHRLAKNGELVADYRVTVEEIYSLEDKPRSRGCRMQIGVLKRPLDNV